MNNTTWLNKYYINGAGNKITRLFSIVAVASFPVSLLATIVLSKSLLFPESMAAGFLGGLFTFVFIAISLSGLDDLRTISKNKNGYKEKRFKYCKCKGDSCVLDHC